MKEGPRYSSFSRDLDNWAKQMETKDEQLK